MKFEWDPRKAEINLRKHGVSFDEQAPYFWTVSRFRVLIPSTRSVNHGTLLLECHVWGVCSLFRIRTGLAQFELSLPAV